MQRAGLAGVLLMGFAAVAWLASDLVGTAYAARQGGPAVTLAVTTGPDLLLRQRASRPAVMALPTTEGRTLVCRTVTSVAGISFGYACRSS